MNKQSNERLEVREVKKEEPEYTPLHSTNQLKIITLWQKSTELQTDTRIW